LTQRFGLSWRSRPGEPPIATEIELKLAAQPDDLALLEMVLRRMAPASQSGAETLVSTYFDTPDRALRRAGLVLRVRQKNGGFVQTVKSDAAEVENLLARGEWEDAVADNRPHPEAPQSGGLLPPEAVADLRPLFVTEVSRTAIEVEPLPGTVVEAALDRGAISSSDGARVEPVSEIEFELKQGEPTALYDLGLRLLETAPLRLETRSKAERGYRLAEGDAAAPPAPYFAAPVDLDSAMTADAALQRIGRACLAHFLRNEAAALAGEPEGVHQMRVALRRLRAALLAFKRAIRPPERERVGEDLRWLNEPLGDARNLDVFSTQLLRPAEADLDLHGLALALDEARRTAYERMRERIRSPQYTAALLRLTRWFEGCGWRENGRTAAAPVGPLARRVLDRRRRKVRRRSAGFGRMGPAERHKLRIAVKNLRYAVELLASLFDPSDMERYVKRLKRLQDDLGYANDVRVAHELVAGLCPPAAGQCAVAEAAARLLAQHDHALARAEPELRDHLRRLNRAAPFWRD
jgi:triphosphatase